MTENLVTVDRKSMPDRYRADEHTGLRNDFYRIVDNIASLAMDPVQINFFCTEKKALAMRVNCGWGVLHIMINRKRNEIYTHHGGPRSFVLENNLNGAALLAMFACWGTYRGVTES